MLKKIWAVIAVLMLSIMACQASGATPQIPAAVTPAILPANQIPVSDNSNPAINSDLLVNLYQSISPGIVTIQVTAADGSGFLGSGFVYDSAGHIVTNYHIVQGASRVEVDFMSGFKTYGTVIGTDLDSDIAVVKVDAPAAELHPVTLGDSSNLKVGQTVIAIGNPFGLNGTMTLGIISSLGRTLESAHNSPSGSNYTAGDLIQTDAAINPGNSGGPLLNKAGEVIGIIRAIRTLNSTASGEALNSGIAFAISVNIVKRVLPGLIRDGKYDYPYLGIASLPDLGLPEIEALGLKTFTGAYVTNVAAGGPADKAGIKAGDKNTNIPGLFAGGDLIVALDGHPVRHFDELLSYLITNKSPGDSVVLTVLRGDQKVDITVKLDKRP
jgi:S1-C subfamily serine protease